LAQLMFLLFSLLYLFIYLFIIYLFLFFYSHVHTLFGPFLPPALSYFIEFHSGIYCLFLSYYAQYSFFYPMYEIETEISNLDFSFFCYSNTFNY
jgi:hypothetical protein